MPPGELSCRIVDGRCFWHGVQYAHRPAQFRQIMPYSATEWTNQSRIAHWLVGAQISECGWLSRFQF